MLSLDHHRKRKNIQRQRNRLISPELGQVPYNQFPARSPFAEHIVHTPHYHTPNPISPPPVAADSSPYAWPPHVNPSLLFDASRISNGYVQRSCLSGPLSHSIAGEQSQHYSQQTEKVPVASGDVLRRPIVIFGSNHKDVAYVPGMRGRRLVVHSAVSILLLFIVIGTFMIVAPVGDGKEVIAQGPLQLLFNVSVGRRSNVALISAESATATAVTVDGYDPGNIHYAGVTEDGENSVVQAGNLSRFFYGQCTYWADMRYHQLTGRWIPWLGDAYEWAYQAPAYNWILSNTPNPHGYSIMVFSPEAEGSGAYGHVAVVERVNPDGSVLTSNWNWNGMWATQSWLTFYPGKGISFIWYPD